MSPRSPQRSPVSMTKRSPRPNLGAVLCGLVAVLIGAVIGLGIWAAIPDEPDVIRITTPVCAPAGG